MKVMSAPPCPSLAATNSLAIYEPSSWMLAVWTPSVTASVPLWLLAADHIARFNGFLKSKHDGHRDPLLVFTAANENGHRFGTLFPEGVTARRGDPRPPRARDSWRRLATPPPIITAHNRPRKAPCTQIRHFMDGKETGRYEPVKVLQS